MSESSQQQPDFTAHPHKEVLRDYAPGNLVPFTDRIRSRAVIDKDKRIAASKEFVRLRRSRAAAEATDENTQAGSTEARIGNLAVQYDEFAGLIDFHLDTNTVAPDDPAGLLDQSGQA
ncbi:MAG TPA: hypothetical protein VK978_00545 [Candidatus Saccharimonadales bacterium]|nr:hypothetical protein [Candidatus Saccharimonadales bacterium]